MLLVRFKEAGFTGQSSRFCAGRIYTDIQDIPTLMSLQEALGSHRPLSLVNIPIDLLARRRRFLLVSRIFAYFWKRCASLCHSYYYLSLINIVKDCNS